MTDGDGKVFMMGEFAAQLPIDLLYATNHMWAQPIGSSQYRFGLTSYAVRLLQDVYFLDWTVDAPAAVGYRQAIGSIESKKAESDLFAPIAGTIECFNEAALADPSVINAEIYSGGWLFNLRGDGSALLTVDQYLDHLESAWQVAQRTIKGQI